MNYKIVPTEDFDKAVKRLSKKYNSLKADLIAFQKDLLKNPEMGDKIDENTRKVRMAITSKNKGKSGGARIITCNILVDITFTKIYLLTIYDKSEQQSISADRIKNLKKINDLL